VRIPIGCWCRKSTSLRSPRGYLGEALFEHPFFAELRGSHSSLGSNSTSSSCTCRAERVFRLGKKWHLLLRDELGASLVSRFSQLPTVFRFFGRRRHSVRGFAYNDLSPPPRRCAPRIRTPSSSCANPTAACSSIAGYIKVGGKNVITGTVESDPRSATQSRHRHLFRLRQCLRPLRHEASILRWRRRAGAPAGPDARRGHSPNPCRAACAGTSPSNRFLSVRPGPRLHINFSPKL